MKTTRLLAAMLLATGLLQLPVAHAVSAAVAKPLKDASEIFPMAIDEVRN